MRKEVGAHLRRPLTSLRSAKRMEWVRKSPFPIELLSLRIQNLTRRQVVCPAASKADRLTGWSAARIELLFLILTPANKNPPRLSSNQVNNTFQFAALETNTQREGNPLLPRKGRLVAGAQERVCPLLLLFAFRTCRASLFMRRRRRCLLHPITCLRAARLSDTLQILFERPRAIGSGLTHGELHENAP